MAHENHRSAPDPSKIDDKNGPAGNARFQEINETYLRDVKPLFQKSCFNCHSQFTQFPWYHSIPGVKNLIDSDIKEARKHLDFSFDFPFHGHGTPEEDLKAIRKSIEEGSMPPFRYRVMHWGSALSENEKNTLFKWIDHSQRLLGEPY